MALKLVNIWRSYRQKLSWLRFFNGWRCIIKFIQLNMLLLLLLDMQKTPQFQGDASYVSADSIVNGL